MKDDAAEQSDLLRDEPARHEPLEILFVLPRLGFLRFFQSTLDLLIARGHRLHLLLESTRADETERAWLEQAQRHPNFTTETRDHFKRSKTGGQQAALRLGMEYVRRLAPVYENRAPGRPRARLARAPRIVRALTHVPLVERPAGLRALYRVLASLDRAVPVPEEVTRYLGERRPAVMAICDKGQPGSLSSGYVRAGRALGIPTALCVASWDNLTNRQRIPVAPHTLFVWNERQRQEAVEIHGLRPDDVTTTGAPRFDDWFTWQARDRDAFLGQIGLDPSKPVILWIGCALNPAETTEAEFVAEWIRALRASGDPLLREAGVIVRPHPERVNDWLATDFSSFSNVTMWPAAGMTFPIDDDGKAGFFDSIFHSAAVVGINTSAMIEASIVGRPVFTVLAPVFHDSQHATFHFSYLLRSEGGPVADAATMDEHLRDLGAALADRDAAAAEQATLFVRDFVRPHGLDRPATEIFVDAIEELARTPVSPERDSWTALPGRAAVLAAMRLDRDARRTSATAVRATRAARRVIRRRVRPAIRHRLVRPAQRGLKAAQRVWRHQVQIRLAHLLKLPDRFWLRRAGALDAVRTVERAQPNEPAPDYTDLRYLFEVIRARRPETVLELGSGCTTAVIATALRANGAGRVWSVESDPSRAAAAEAALPAELREVATVVYSPVLEDDRDVPGWSYERIPDIAPDFVYVDGPPYTKERRVSFDVLDLEPRLRPGAMLVVDGRGRVATYLHERLSGRYAFSEQRHRWRHMARYTFELLDRADAPAPPAPAAVGSTQT